MSEEQGGHTAPSASGVNSPQGPPQIVAGGRKKIYHIRGTTFEVDAKYELIKAIGLGAYGLVCSAKDLETNKFVAIKKVPKLFDDLIDSQRVLRELKIMRHLGRHDNIIKLIEIPTPREATLSYFSSFSEVYQVLELMETDLHLVLKGKQRLTAEHFAYFLYQLLKGIVYIHSAGVIHRDLKPSNLLLNRACDLKICDFGLARGGLSAIANSTDTIPDQRDDVNTTAGDDVNHELTDYVITRWYRPPELLLMTGYNHSADLWSIGCIMGEMILRKPLFPGRDYLNQLALITEVVELPSNETLRAMVPHGGSEGIRFVAQQATKTSGTAHERMCAKLNVNEGAPPVVQNAVNLIEKLLLFSPSQRMTAAEAIRHPFFVKHYKKSDEIYYQPQSAAAEDAKWAFEDRNLTETDLRELFWSEMGGGEIFSEHQPTE